MGVRGDAAAVFYCFKGAAEKMETDCPCECIGKRTIS